MDLQPGETCAVVTDDKRQAIGEALYAVASEITDDAILFRYPPGTSTARNRPNPSPPRWLAPTWCWRPPPRA